MQQPRWQARIREDQNNTATVAVRGHSFGVGVPLHFDVDYEHISALEYVLGAIGADVVNGLRALARKRRIAIDSLEATVHGELDNALMHLGVVGEEGHPGMKKICVKVYISSMSDAGEVQRVWDEMLQKSPLVCTFRPVLDFEIDYKLVF